MQAAFDTTFQSRLARLDLTDVLTRVKEETGLDDQTLAKGVEMYHQFLTLHHLYPEQSFIAPVIVDHIWDTHVLFTRQYAADCEMLFGRFLHHQPHNHGTDEAYEATTIPAYQQAFGVNLALARQLNPSLFAAAECGS